ncbi:rRNA maturation RNAse YbeY [Nannocystis radixulma]|uniref:Endoribonuclease YbeY n=1 Tax=Nannocystis radixulma TaxID=2995305 RepID=A0ABT5BF43_9BACT|nr:rRNA maturation RNAse YbeY [Nannocystis radixulma]MDC0671601.1 rRNA maturation RNAse YbeY [Nannocystis radixulma]
MGSRGNAADGGRAERSGDEGARASEADAREREEGPDLGEEDARGSDEDDVEDLADVDDRAEDGDDDDDLADEGEDGSDALAEDDADEDAEDGEDEDDFTEDDADEDEDDFAEDDADEDEDDFAEDVEDEEDVEEPAEDAADEDEDDFAEDDADEDDADLAEDDEGENEDHESESDDEALAALDEDDGDALAEDDESEDDAALAEDDEREDDGDALDEDDGDALAEDDGDALDEDDGDALDEDEESEDDESEDDESEDDGDALEDDGDDALAGADEVLSAQGFGAPATARGRFVSGDDFEDMSFAPGRGRVRFTVAPRRKAPRWFVQALARRVARAARRLGIGADSGVTCHLVDDPAIAALNAEHMGKVGPTDVLSFPSGPLGPGGGAGGGDVVISVDAVRRQARARLGISAAPDDMTDGTGFKRQVLWGLIIETGPKTPVLPDMVEGSAEAAAAIDEATVLAVHGLCHLLGHDHGDRREALAMHRAERRGLRAADTPDVPRPYGIDARRERRARRTR